VDFGSFLQVCLMRIRRGVPVFLGGACLLFLLCVTLIQWYAGFTSSSSSGGGGEGARWHRVDATLKWDELRAVDLTSPSLYSAECLRLPLPDENCPVFYRCPLLLPSNISYCLNPRLADLTTGDFNFAYSDRLARPALAPYRLQPLHLNVFLLDGGGGAYVGGRGQVFGPSVVYNHGGCASEKEYPVLLQGATLRSYPRVLVLVDPLPEGWNHHLLHHLPLLFQVRKLIEQVPDLVVVFPQEAADKLDLALRILDLRVPPSNLLFLAPTDIIHSPQVFLPAKPPCTIPSASAWRGVRDHLFSHSHLLLPLATGDPAPPSGSTVAVQKSVVVLREGLEDPEALASYLRDKFGAKTAVVQGAESFKVLVEQFGTANILIGVSTAPVFDLVVFLPKKATVFELVSEADKDLTGAHLCRALGLTHKALEGNSTSSSQGSSSSGGGGGGGLRVNFELLATMLELG